MKLARESGRGTYKKVGEEKEEGRATFVASPRHDRRPISNSNGRERTRTRTKDEFISKQAN